MPAPIINGLAGYLEAQLVGITVWDGEVPRSDPNGIPALVDQGPVFRVVILEPGFERRHDSFESPYGDIGTMLAQVWATTRAVAEAQMNLIEALLANSSNWPNIELTGGPVINPYSVYDLELTRWWSGQEEGVRTQTSQLIYRADLYYQCGIHGAIITR